MRYVYENYEMLKSKCKKNSKVIKERFSWDKTLQKLLFTINLLIEK